MSRVSRLTASSSCSKTRLVSPQTSVCPSRAVSKMSLYLLICSVTCFFDVTRTLYSRLGSSGSRSSGSRSSGSRSSRLGSSRLGSSGSRSSGSRSSGSRSSGSRSSGSRSSRLGSSRLGSSPGSSPLATASIFTANLYLPLGPLSLTSSPTGGEAQDRAGFTSTWHHVSLRRFISRRARCSAQGMLGAGGIDTCTLQSQWVER
ncbi:hypothetical protein EYF80_050632 [Liparis tanakae]|uniref:Uncharacterized protein n=1 Tax=Liparis tanakae TaxID=230148 RepID=A0A4Z2FDZ1_9TELE|nr:hypothetical protein EYF80_050632 [Liparis tanakae]